MPASFRPPGLVVIEHEFDLPLDHGRGDGERIRVFAREVGDPDGMDRPFLVFLQGGPGYEAPRPVGVPASPGWLERALEEFRVLMLDQRGTGRSTPVGALEGRTPQEQAEYLTHFRADAIVRDAELIREALGVDRWSVLGQSFGGMCVTAYLSTAPDSLEEALITGGVPPVERHVDEVYTATWARQQERVQAFYERYPTDREIVRAIARRLADEDVRDAFGDRLTARRFRTLGSHLGMSDGPEELHYRLELPLDSPAFRHDVGADTNWSRNPLYAILNEASWANGHATNWSAQRMMPSDYAEDPEHLTGEHLFPWMLEDIAALRPLAGAAEILASHEWPALYDPEHLRRNEVPTAAAIYADDPYVERAFSEETAAITGNFHPWVTNEYLHNGLRADGGRILGRLLDLVRGRA
jgi:pimeloyl-ACP methyl ester carboxylesterase